jgi:hypothetical protein
MKSSKDDPEKVFFQLAFMLDRYRKENAALKAMLRERGMAAASIRRHLKKRRDEQESFEDAFLVFARVCRETLDVLHADSPATILEKIPTEKLKVN